MKTVTRVAIAVVCLGASPGVPPQAAGQSVPADEAREIARDAYVYAYPLVLMKVTRDVGTNAGVPNSPTAPLNQLGHARWFPDPTFSLVVRPNVDALYTALAYDVSAEPLVVTVPDSGGRYYLHQWLDGWTDVFTAPGSRTTGPGPLTYAVVGPCWKGVLPAGVTEYRSPTGSGLLIGRTRTDGKGDYAAVRKFQDGMSAVPLSAYGKPYAPPKGRFDPGRDMSPPPDQVEGMDAATFFATFAELLKANSPHANDYPILDRMRRIGLEPGKSFRLADAPGPVREALTAAPEAALKMIRRGWTAAGPLAGGWRVNGTAIGTYGTDYLRRAGVAYAALGANVPEDALYPTAFADAEGRPLSSGERYVLHFDKGRTPPARAFWSLTMYDERQRFAANPIDRFALGDRDGLTFNPDGSLDLYVQRESPGKGKESNWLPTPWRGGFSMTLRLYWPRPEALDGTWSPPAVKRVR